MTTLTHSTSVRELRPMLAALALAALRLKLQRSPEERKGTKGQGEIQMEATKL
jgi:hypothetical protein